MEAIVDSVIMYVVGALLILCLILGFTTYTYHNANVLLKEQAVELTTNLRTSEANVLLAKNSCVVTTTITDEVSTKIEDKQTKMTNTLVELVALPKVKEISNGSTKNYADDSTLSPDLMRLLNKAYCDASSSDPACSPSGTTKAVSGAKAKE